MFNAGHHACGWILAATTAHLARASADGCVQAVKRKDQDIAGRREPISRRPPRAKQPDSDVPRDRFQSRDESAPHGLFFEVKEGTCPNADWTITLLSEARPRARNLFFQTDSASSSQDSSQV